MATRERGFMGEKFPSKKFRQVMAKFLGHADPIVQPSTDIRDQFNIAGEPKPLSEFTPPTFIPPEIPTILIPEPPPIPQPNCVEEYAQRVWEAATKQQIYEMPVLQPYMDMLNNYKRELQMAKKQLKNSTPVGSPSYDEVLEENKTLKAKCEALEEREQIIIDSIIECFGRRPVIIDDVLQLSGESYNEMVRKINKLRITE